MRFAARGIAESLTGASWASADVRVDEVRCDDSGCSVTLQRSADPTDINAESEWATVRMTWADLEVGPVRLAIDKAVWDQWPRELVLRLVWAA